MGYIPTEWQTGDVITAAKLNKAEEGIAAAYPVFIPITFDETANSYVLGASYNELKDNIGHIVIGIEEYQDDPYLCTYFIFTRLSVEEDDTYVALFFSPADSGGGPVSAISPFRATDPDENMKWIIPV